MTSNRKQTSFFLGMVSLMMPAALIAPPALGDAISPRMNNGDREYSTEKPNSAYYGRGTAGRQVEASELRLQGDQLMADGELEEARKKLGKAVKLDPGDPDGHIMYARCITKILFSKKTVDESLLARCIGEWRLIAYHDADQLEQAEAKAQAKRLIKIAKVLEKRKRDREKEKEKEQQGGLLAQKTATKEESSDRPAEKNKQEEKEPSLSEGNPDDE